MSIGLTVNRAELDAQLANVTLAFRNAADAARELKVSLDRYSTDDMQAWGPDPVYTPTEAAQVKSAVADLAQIADVFYGDATQGTAVNFLRFAGLATGFR